MGVSFREGNEQGGGGRGRGRGGNRFRKTLNGNYIKQGGDDTNEDSTRPQVSNGGQWHQQHDACGQHHAYAQYTGSGRQCARRQLLSLIARCDQNTSSCVASDAQQCLTPLWQPVACVHMCSCWSSAWQISWSRCWAGPSSPVERTGWDGS